jgi:hypothetical protein
MDAPAREISRAQAVLAYAVLVEEAGARPDLDGLVQFLIAVRGRNASSECRFIGSLGFGGKFRNARGRGGIPYVECYAEDETPARLAAIARANAALAAIFAPSAGAGD